MKTATATQANELATIRRAIKDLTNRQGWQDDAELTALIIRRDELVADQQPAASVDPEAEYWAMYR